MKDDFMMTQSGIHVTPLVPKAEQIYIEDIAHALSHLCRANGHTKYFYSVAQHSINCAAEAKARGYSRKLQLTALLHDASEAYMADLIRPVKQFIPQYSVLEDKLLAVILNKYGLDALLPIEIKQIDDAMLYAEFKILCGAELAHYKAELKSDSDFSERIASSVKDNYLKLFNELTQ